MKSYADKLKDPRWQKKRLEIMKRDKWTCKKCGDTETTLNVHHLKYENGNDPWEYENKDLITICEDCHKEIETLKDDNPNFEFSLIKIYKSSGWTNDNRIMFISHDDICTMRIYEGDKFITGFNLREWNIKEFIRIFKHTLKQCELTDLSK
jgi:hypothetical protein